MKRRFATLFVCFAAIMGLFCQTAAGVNLKSVKTAVNAGRIQAHCVENGDYAYVESYNQSKGTLKVTLESRGSKTTDYFVFYDKTGAELTMAQVKEYARGVGVTFYTDGTQMQPKLRLPYFYTESGRLALCVGMGLGSEKSGSVEDTAVLVYTGNYERGSDEVRFECMNMNGELRFYSIREVRIGSDYYEPKDCVGMEGALFTAALLKSGGYRLTWSPATVISPKFADPNYISGVTEGMEDPVVIQTDRDTRYYDVRSDDSGEWGQVSRDHLESAVKNSDEDPWYIVVFYEGRPEGNDPAMAVYMISKYQGSKA